MKKLIFIPIVLLFISSVSFGNIIPESHIILLETSTMTVSVDKKIEGLFEVASISEDQNNLDFITTLEVEFIKIFNSKGELEFQLPVSSTKVRVSSNLFDGGKYELGFVVKGKKDIQYVDVQLK